MHVTVGSKIRELILAGAIVRRSNQPQIFRKQIKELRKPLRPMEK